MVAVPCDWLASVYCQYVRKARLGWLILLWPSLECEGSAFYPMSFVGMKTMQKKCGQQGPICCHWSPQGLGVVAY